MHQRSSVVRSSVRTGCAPHRRAVQHRALGAGQRPVGHRARCMPDPGLRPDLVGTTQTRLAPPHDAEPDVDARSIVAENASSAAEPAVFGDAADRLGTNQLNEVEVHGTVHRSARARRLLRWGPDGPEGPRPSDIRRAISIAAAMQPSQLVVVLERNGRPRSRRAWVNEPTLTSPKSSQPGRKPRGTPRHRAVRQRLSAGPDRTPDPGGRPTRLRARHRGSSATELSGGTYDTAYRIDLAGREEPVVLRVAPEPSRQFHSEQEPMR